MNLGHSLRRGRRRALTLHNTRRPRASTCIIPWQMCDVNPVSRTPWGETCGWFWFTDITAQKPQTNSLAREIRRCELHLRNIFNATRHVWDWSTRLKIINVLKSPRCLKTQASTVITLITELLHALLQLALAGWLWKPNLEHRRDESLDASLARTPSSLWLLHSGAPSGADFDALQN